LCYLRALLNKSQQPSAIPTIGSSDPNLSFTSAIKFVTHGKEMLNEGAWHLALGYLLSNARAGYTKVHHARPRWTLC